MIPGSVHPLLAGGSSYLVQNSLRFSTDAATSLSRTSVAAPTSNTTYTWSSWAKLGRAIEATTNYGELFSGYAASTDAGFGELHLYNGCLRLGGAITIWRNSTQVFRDPTAWYHILMAIDTTQSTAANRIKLYVNGSQVTSFSTSNDPTQNTTIGFGNSSATQRIGLDAPASSTRNLDGYLSEVYFIDGQALTPSSFGETDNVTGVWVPKKYTGTYGTNGFYLEFKDASAATNTAIGKDSSGNGNHFTPSGVSVTSGNTFDQMVDTPTLNYPTLSMIDKSAAVVVNRSTLKITGGSAGGVNTFSQTGITFNLPTYGKWYFEFKRDSAGADANGFGVNITRNYRGGNGWPATRGNDGYPGYYSFEYGFAITHDIASNNLTWRNNFIVTGASVATNSTSSTATTAIYGFAVDCDNNLAYMYENGILKTNSNGLSFVHPGANAVVSIWKSDHIVSVNFGQQPFAYTPPTGYKALNSNNLLTPTIKKPNIYFDTITRTGTGAAATISSLNFQPDLVWIKSRNAATNNNIFDSSRGVGNTLVTNSTTVEVSNSNTLTSFTGTGYTLGQDNGSKGVNINTNTYVDWSWKKGATPGFDIVTYNGNNLAQTLSHGLGVVPSMMIVKNRTGLARQWSVYHNSIASSETGGIYLNLTNAWNADSTLFNSTAPTSTQFTVGTYYSVIGESYVSYLFSEVSGFSRFGSYTGNGSTDGPFVWCGFRPRWLFWKRTNSTGSWGLYDTARSTYNPIRDGLLIESAGIEFTYDAFDILSSGFKVRASGAGTNASGDTHIFAAFAETPFKYARAR